MNTIYFNRKLNNKKPSTIRNKETSCPFCDRNQIAGIIDEQDDMILIKNKFSTFKDAMMLVLIESKQCDSDMHTYSIAKLESLLGYAIKTWSDIIASGEFENVILFKNKGLHSSGTISHPHMQIIGFKEQDTYTRVSTENLQGFEIAVDDIEFNLSTLPLISFLEFNIEITEDIHKLAKTVSFLTKYIEKTYWGPEASYNFFFYQIDGKRYLKIIPRYPTSAVHIGYGIIQLYDNEQLQDYHDSLTEYYSEFKSKHLMQM